MNLHDFQDFRSSSQRKNLEDRGIEPQRVLEEAKVLAEKQRKVKDQLFFFGIPGLPGWDSVTHQGIYRGEHFRNLWHKTPIVPAVKWLMVFLFLLLFDYSKKIYNKL